MAKRTPNRHSLGLLGDDGNVMTLLPVRRPPRLIPYGGSPDTVSATTPSLTRNDRGSVR